jgi:hypothetical protein
MIKQRVCFPPLPKDSLSDEIAFYDGLKALRDESGERLPEVENRCLAVLETLFQEIAADEKMHQYSSHLTAYVPELRVTPLRRSEWLDLAVLNSDVFEQGMSDAGFDREYAEAWRKTRDKVSQDLGDRPADDAGFVDWLGRFQNAKVQIQGLLGFFKYRCEEVRSVPCEIPLFWLSSPDVEGCVVDYAETLESGNTHGWTISLAGVGMGDSSTLGVSVEVPYRSCWHTGTLVFLPLKLDARLLQPVRDGKAIGASFWRVEVPRAEAVTVVCPSRPVQPIELRDHLSPLEAQGRIEDISIPLSQDQSNGPRKFTFSWSASHETESFVGLDLPGFKTKYKFKASCGRKVNISGELVPRHNYLMRRDTQGTGIWWKVE